MHSDPYGGGEVEERWWSSGGAVEEKWRSGGGAVVEMLLDRASRSGMHRSKDVVSGANTRGAQPFTFATASNTDDAWSG